MRTNTRHFTPAASIVVLLLAPLALGAKGGCSHAVVGDDGACKTEECGEAGMDGMTGGSTGTGGGNATGGGPAHGGSSGSIGTGGSVATGGSSGSTATGGGPASGGTSGSTATGGGPAQGGSGGVGGGEPGAVCGGLRGSQCSSGQFCDFTLDAICGFADATGHCAAIPEGCTTNDDPVCGCDSKTYSNACEANRHGVAVQKAGACETDPGDACGGLQGLECADGEFCDFALGAMCGAADQTGTCAAIPDGCTKEYIPVCGCDDVTYGNACDAHAHGVAVAAEGACESEPTHCGGIAAIQCDNEGDYCDYDISTHCGSDDQGGTCKPKPEGCIADYDPVCGCDDKTYGNVCEAARSGVSVQSTGACPTT